MSQAAKKENIIPIKDISKEPKVRAKSAKREVTHTIALVPPNFVNSLWPDVREELMRAVDRSHGRWTIEALFSCIANGQQHLWVAFDADKNIDGVGTTEIVMYPGKKMLVIQFLGGKNFNDWVWDMLEKFNDWAKDNQCHGIEATARMGFWQWLKQDDFERSYVVYEKRID
jgi:hypothetical protein